MNRGYVKMFRCIEDNILWQSDEPFCRRAAWEDLIMLANHDDNEFLIGSQKIVVKRGQHWTSIVKLMNRWHWSERKLLTYLKLLENEGMIYLETTNRGSMITLVNYGKFQDFRSTLTEQMQEQKTEQKNNRGITDAVSVAVSDDGQTIMTKNDIKNDIKNEIKMKKKPSASFDFCGEVVYEE